MTTCDSYKGTGKSEPSVVRSRRYRAPVPLCKLPATTERPHLRGGGRGSVVLRAGRRLGDVVAVRAGVVVVPGVRPSDGPHGMRLRAREAPLVRSEVGRRGQAREGLLLDSRGRPVCPGQPPTPSAKRTRGPLPEQIVLGRASGPRARRSCRHHCHPSHISTPPERSVASWVLFTVGPAPHCIAMRRDHLANGHATRSGTGPCAQPVQHKGLSACATSAWRRRSARGSRA